MEALHRLNLNPMLAQIPRLMELVICGEASYEDAKAAYLLTYRAPFFESDAIAEHLNRAEYLSFLQGAVVADHSVSNSCPASAARTQISHSLIAMARGSRLIWHTAPNLANGSLTWHVAS